ncbi:MAG: hypothetical protein J0I10_21625 [Verrucomicrobia bacterium]|nr:hypothetical protein [Verrucomicrobiota bacterium]
MRSLFLKWTLESQEISCEKIKYLLGIDVSDSWSIGGKIAKSLLVHEANGVKIETRFDGNFNQEESLRDFVGNYEELVSLAIKKEPSIKALLSVVVYSDDRSGIFLERDIIKRIAETASGFDYDFYPLN